MSLNRHEISIGPPGRWLTPVHWRILGATITGFALLVLAYLVIPTLVILPLSLSPDSYLAFPPSGVSLRWYQDFLDSADYRIAILNSLKIGLPSALLAGVFGTMAALAFARAEFPFRRSLGMLMIAPIVLPQIVLAIGLYPLMAKIGIVGSFGGIILAHAVVAMPLVFISVSAALNACPVVFERAAATMGANHWQVFRHVTLPLIRPGVIVGMIFAFAFSFDELILAMFLTSASTRTVPRLLWEQLNFQMTPLITAASVVLLMATMGLLLISAWINRDRTAQRRKDAP